MQQTDKYKLNLIERDDVFSPDALNENMEKVEAQLDAVQISAAAGDAAEAAARAAADAALDQRLQVFEAHKLVIGQASSESSIEYLGFTPRLLYAVGGNGSHLLAIDSFSSYSGLRIEEGGFYHNGAYSTCRYVAFA